MSALWTAQEVATATGGRIGGDWQATGVSIDSRSVTAGDLFVALVDRRDGHDFVADALAKGAAAALVARVPEGCDEDRLCIVADTQTALEALGTASRARTRARVVGITGSVGKTGTKAALAHGLRRLAPTHASVKSYNNHWGVPLSLAQMPADAALGIFEMGMNRAGEIRRLVRQVRPEGAIITAIAPAHLEFFEDESGIARAKAEIFEGVTPGGFAVVVGDSPHTPRLVAAARAAGIARIVTFGEGADVRARAVRADATGSDVEATLAGRDVSYRIGLAGPHWVKNSLALLATVEAMELDVERFAAALAELQPEPGRGRAHAIAIDGGTATLIDDSYNANPASMRAALQVLGLAPGRKLAALGAMKELGPDAPRMHRELVDPIVACGVSVVFTAGEEMRALARALPKDLSAVHEENVQTLIAQVQTALRPGDTLLVKGSLASGMGRLVEALVEGGR